MKKQRYLLAFDPSLDGTGYCVLDCRYKEPRLAEIGTVKGRNKTWGDTPYQVKLALIQSKVKELRAKYDPIYPKVFLEKGFSRFNNDTQAIYRARGALESELVGLEIVEYSPNTIKKVVAHHGHATKEDVKNAVASIFNVPLDVFETEDESDATAVAYTGYIKEYAEEDN